MAVARVLPSDFTHPMQSPDLKQNHFELFGLRPAFAVDRQQLHAEQQRLQATFHPDRFVNASDQEKRLSVQMASRINQAYDVLQNPVKRAGYLLEISGANLPDDSATTSDTEFLMEQIELREAIEACREHDEPLKQCAVIESRLQHRAEQLAREFQAEFDANRLDSAANSSRKMMFIQRIQQQLADLQFELEDF